MEWNALSKELINKDNSSSTGNYSLAPRKPEASDVLPDVEFRYLKPDDSCLRVVKKREDKSRTSPTSAWVITV